MGSSWDLVGGDPAPGDPGAIGDCAKVLERIGDDAATSRDQLRAVHDQWAQSDWSGPAADVFRSRIVTVVPDLGKTADSYGTGGEALAQFAATLETLQADAQQALQRAVTAQDRVLDSNAASQEARERANGAGAEAARIGSEIVAIDGEITARQVLLGAAAAADSTIQTWKVQVAELQGQKNAYEEQARQAASDIVRVEGEGRDAQATLNSARADVDHVRASFASAVRIAKGRLEEAGSRGIRNLSFWQRDFHKLTSAVEHVSSEVFRDESRYLKDIALIGTGHLSGFDDLSRWAEHDIVAASPEIHAITHAWARVSDDLAAAVHDCGPFFPIICTVAGAGIGFLVGGPAGALLGAKIGYKVAPDLETAVDANATLADEAEVGSDDLMEADGKGSQVNLASDTSVMKGNAANTIGDVAEDSVEAVTGVDVPDVGTVVSQAVATGHVNVKTVIVHTIEGGIADEGAQGLIEMLAL